MRKDSRLSFRISPELSKRVELAIFSDLNLRDRSEFGTKAVNFYLDFLKISENEQDKILQAVLALADHIKLESKEIKKLRGVNNIHEPSIFEHPRYESVLDLKERFLPEIQEEISDELANADYDDLDKLFNKYQEMFYKYGIKHKKEIRAKAEILDHRL